MPAERLSMRKLRELLRLRLANGLSQRAIARSLGLSQGAVCDYLDRARRAGLSWPCRELARRCRARAPAVPACADNPCRAASAAGLGGGPSRAAPAGT